MHPSFQAQRMPRQTEHSGSQKASENSTKQRLYRLPVRTTGAWSEMVLPNSGHCTTFLLF
jgi:hypothetical protein